MSMFIIIQSISRTLHRVGLGHAESPSVPILKCAANPGDISTNLPMLRYLLVRLPNLKHNLGQHPSQIIAVYHMICNTYAAYPWVPSTRVQRCKPAKKGYPALYHGVSVSISHPINQLRLHFPLPCNSPAHSPVHGRPCLSLLHVLLRHHCLGCSCLHATMSLSPGRMLALDAQTDRQLFLGPISGIKSRRAAIAEL